MWYEQGGFSVDYPHHGMYYDIPERCLRSVAVDKLFMAGKCISADSGAIASAGVIACFLATGEAAAKLAAGKTGSDRNLFKKDRGFGEVPGRAGKFMGAFFSQELKRI